MLWWRWRWISWSVVKQWWYRLTFLFKGWWSPCFWQCTPGSGMTRSLSKIQWGNWLIGKTKTKRLLYKDVAVGVRIPKAVIIYLWRVIHCFWIFIFGWNRGRSILFASGTIRKDSLIKNGPSGNKNSTTLLWPETVSLDVWLVSYKYHLLWCRRELVLSLIWVYPDICECSKNPKIRYIRLVSLEEFKRCSPFITTHGLLVIDM